VAAEHLYCADCGDVIRKGSEYWLDPDDEPQCSRCHAGAATW
jgi:hypothetical protein